MRRVFLVGAICLACAAHASADQVIASVQQKLKDSGFYYGEITGQKDADTTAAIRRYQIRNGLKITGDLNPETEKSLGVKGGSSSSQPPPAATPPPRTAPPSHPANPLPPETDDLRDYTPPAQPQQRAPNQYATPPPPPSGYAPGPRGLTPEMSGALNGTPYEVAPPDVQRRVIAGAQTLLARRGLYRAPIDGSYGPAMAFAVRAFQQRFAIAASGRLDMDTLAALGLFPGQPAHGVTAPRHRTMRRPAVVGPDGEPIYQPR